MPIDHVVVLVLENRSFDHMLGFLRHPDRRFEGLAGSGPYDNPGWDGGPRVAATPAAKAVLPFGPDHSHDAVMAQLGATGSGAGRTVTNQGFVSSYERKGRGLAQATFGGFLAPLIRLLGIGGKPAVVVEGRGPLVMLCQAPDQVPVLSRLALEFAVCDHWFCSVPGETWPNRNFLHAATSDGETNIVVRPYTDPTIFELLEKNNKSWRIYHDDTPQVWAFPRLWDSPERHGNWFPAAKFAVHVSEGDLAAYSFIEPNHRPPVHTVDVDPNTPGLSTSQHPENNLVPNDTYDTHDSGQDSDFARGEALIAGVYEALRANPELFARTLLLITYDEHGGLYDHVPPPTDAPNPGHPKSALGRLLDAILHRRARPFDFTLLGPRVPAVIVSPLIPTGTLDNRIHDHASVPSTIRTIFAPQALPLTARDKTAIPFHDVATLVQPRTNLPDLSGFTRATMTSLTSTVTETSEPIEPSPDTTELTTEQTPHYYDDFINQAEAVRKHLDEVGEPEIKPISAAKPATTQLAAEVTIAFAKAAHRHRHTTGRADTTISSE